MTIRELIKKPFLTPKDVSKITGISVTSARRKIEIIRRELEEKGYINIPSSRVPTKVFVERFNIDIDWLEKVGALDEPLQKKRSDSNKGGD